MKRSFPLAQLSVLAKARLPEGHLRFAKAGSGSQIDPYPLVFGRFRQASAPVIGRFQPLRPDAFTLVELLVVIAIVAILAALTLSTLGYVQKKGAESRARTEVAALSAAIDAYKMDFGFFPESNNLYTELTGQGPTNTNKIYFEPTPGIVDTNKLRFVDPWDGAYQYNPVNPELNVGSFDLWTSNNSPGNQTLWIRN